MTDRYGNPDDDHRGQPDDTPPLTEAQRERFRQWFADTRAALTSPKLPAGNNRMGVENQENTR